MDNQITLSKSSELEHIGNDEIFSPYTHPALEAFIQNVIDSNKNSLPTKTSQKLAREFFLYGFIKTTGQKFKSIWEK